MRKCQIFLSVLLLLVCLLAAQNPPGRPERDQPPRLPDGRLQSEEILKADHKASLKDAGELLRLAEELKIELEKNDRHILSVQLIKKTEDIEKLAKKIRSRMKRF